MADKISIAMATYNGERFLREQLDSLYAQSRVPDEIVVCDDASTDSTAAILKEYHERYGLTYYINETGLRVNANFMRALSLCTGDYAIICDQDDIWLPHKVETLYTAIKATDPTMPVAVSSSRIDIDAEGRIIGRPAPVSLSQGWAATLLRTSGSQGCSMILNRSLINKVLELYSRKPEANEVMYDVLISTTAAILGNKINLPDTLMHYRHHDANVVDRLRTSRKTFWQRVEDMPTYYPFLLDYRISELATCRRIFEGEQVPSDVQRLLDKMQRIHQHKGFIRNLMTIASISASPLPVRCKTLILTPVAVTLKWIHRHYHQVAQL